MYNNDNNLMNQYLKHNSSDDWTKLTSDEEDLGEKDHFNFSENPTLKINSIILSCFANPERKRQFSDLPLWPGKESGS